MSWECKYLSETFCNKRKQECDPGANGCVLQGRFSFPLKEKPKKPEKTNKGQNHSLKRAIKACKHIK